MTVSVIIPWYDSGEPYRQKAKEYVINWWTSNFPGFEVLVGANVGKFNRSASRNMLISQAYNDLLIIADADSVPQLGAIYTAIRYIDTNEGWVIPYDLYQNLSQEYTDSVYEQQLEILDPKDEDCEHQITSWAGILIAPKDAVVGVGGYDERFVGWGHEDVAFRIKLDAEYEKHTRVAEQKLRHLWHPIAKEDQFNSPNEIRNRMLFDKEYKIRYNWRDERIS